MQSLFRKLPLVLLAVFAMSGLMSSSASAAVCHESEHGETVGLCVEGKKITGEKVNLVGELGGTSIEFESSTLSVLVECGAASIAGAFNTSGLSLTLERLKWSFTKCSLRGEPGCEVTPIVAEVSGSFNKGETGQITLKGALSPETELWYELTIKTRAGFHCIFPVNKLKIKGKLQCTLPKSEELLTVHEMLCSGWLRWQSGEARFDVDSRLKLENGKQWGFMVS
jgi:hypothetical protein